MSTRASEQEQTGSAGVSRVIADFADINWGPVENSRHDLGIDLFLQVRDERRFDRTVLLTAQVKAGKSYFRDVATDEQSNRVGWWYTEPDAKHFEDWVQHGLPHLLVLHDDTKRISYWTHVTKGAVESTGDGYKILVPDGQRVEPAGRAALLKVAASGKSAPILQGTAFAAGAKAVAPGRALRHALLTPRLIAPHPNTGYERTLVPNEAIALITQGRFRDLDLYVRKGGNDKMAQATASSRGWGWRFFAAYRQVVTTGDLTPLLDLAAATQPAQARKPKGKKDTKRKGAQPPRIAACAVTAAVFLTDVERWDDAEAVLLAVGEDLPPVDHAWVLMHRAIVLSERGDIDQARVLAATAQRTVALDADDVTAAAIGASAAAFIFQTTRWGTGRDIEATMTAADTAASWWRSQSIAWALADHEEKVFQAWGACADVDAQLSDTGQNRLLGAWLSASLAGARGAAASALSQRAHHELMHHEVNWRSEIAADFSALPDGSRQPIAPGPALKNLEETLDELRRYGCREDMQTATQRLWAAGPAAPVQNAVARSVAAPWTHTNARTKLALLQDAGDLLEPDLADEAARHCLGLLTDPMPFAERVRPTFRINYYAHRALWGMLPAASDAVHQEAAEFVLRVLSEDKSELAEENLAQLITHLRPSTLISQVDQFRTAALDHENKRTSAMMLGALIPCGDSQAEAELMHRTEAGDLEAVAEIPITKLKPTTVHTMIDIAVSHCRQILDDARRNAWGLGGWDWARVLVTCNLSCPDEAQWDPVVSVILEPRAAQDHKIGSVRLMSVRADDLPDPVAAQLSEAFPSGVPSIKGAPGLINEVEDFTEAAFALGLALGAVESATAIQRILAWLRGSTSQRQAAARLVSALGRRAQDHLIPGALVMLTADPQYQVRAAAAASLTRGLQQPPAAAVEAAIITAAREAGCRVPLAIAHTLPHASPAWTAREALQTELQHHISAKVRTAAASQQS